ncbi:SUMO-specific isopeptidase USPL1 [Rhinoderma darwinii]|uniref:SUMO-specific isopeptidase USPL1 n=1 Tax=Rhinoderma darwinii TaxID=43563 RepID=UPI003F66C8BA
MTKICQWVTTMAAKTPGSTVSLVEQGSFLDKPSLLMVGYMGKDPHSIDSPHDGLCPVCKTKGQAQALKTYRINFTQSIFLCSNPQCIYPLGYAPLDNVIAKTADLKKNSSPSKKKKRNISDMSPTPLPCEKRQRMDLPVFDSYTVQADLCPSASGFPELECETSSPTRLQRDQMESTDSQMQNVSGTTNSFSSSALGDEYRFPILPTGSRRYAHGQPDGLPAVENGHQEVLQNGHLEIMDTLNNGSLLHPPENSLIPNLVDKVQVKPTSDKETTESLNEELMLNGVAFSGDSMHSYNFSPSPMLKLECEAKENSSIEGSVPPNYIDALSDLEKTFSMDSGLPQTCLNESPLFQHAQPKEQIENMDDLLDGDVESFSCNKKASLLIQESPTEIIRNTVPELQHEKSDQQIYLSSLPERSPPMCPGAAVQENSFGSVDLSESLKLIHQSCELTTSQSLEDVLQECPAEQRSFTVEKTLASTNAVAEVIEKSQATLPSCELKCQPESLSKDNLDTPLDLTSCKTVSLVPDRSMISPPSIPCPNLSLIQELVHNSQKTNYEEHNPSNSLRDVQPEYQVEEKAFKNTGGRSTTTTPPVKDKAYTDAAAISLPGNPLSETFDGTHPDQNDMATPDDPSQDNQPVCLPDNCPMEKVCESPVTSASIMKDGCIAHTDSKSLNKISLPGPQILLQDCMKCHCKMNMSSQSLQNTETQDKNVANEVANSLLGVTAKVSAQSDSLTNSITFATVENTASSPPIESESPLSKQNKDFYENTILPDLLLDIQLEHRMEDHLLTSPNTACDATVCMTPSDMEVVTQKVLQNGQVKECLNLMETDAMEILSDHIEDDSKLSDTGSLETSFNSEGLADDSDEAMEAKNDGPARVDKAPAAKRLKPAERRLQWKNKHSLCWLDCILSALVQSETLIYFVAEGHHIRKESVIHNLFTRYNEATTMFIQSLKKRKTDKRPRHEKRLNEARIGVFEKLKPFLKCKLGNKDSPVFAFPLLLKLDPETERLFLHSFMWQFKCEACGYSYQQRCENTLTTFTKVLPEWRPLNAVHVGPCNKCQNAEQKRSLVLEKLNSIFMVHFVEGLPSSDLNDYAFQFKGHSYEVKTVIKYRNKHFSTWISNSDGTWLESDDLRGSFCRRHQKFRVRSNDIHIVIWESTIVKTFEDNLQIGAAEQDSELTSTNISMSSQDQSLCSVGAAELSQQVTPTAQSDALNVSNPLAGMEDYADDDVITLTLVEVPLDVNGRPIETLTELQPTNTCASHVVETQGVDTHTAQLEMPTNPQLEGQQHCTFTSPIATGSNSEAVILKDCSVLLSPLKRSCLKPAVEAIATSTPAQQPYNPRRSVVGNWMTRLINKDDSILSLDPLGANKRLVTLKTCPPLKVTDSTSASKKAQSFNGFQGRGMNKTDGNILDAKISNAACKPSFYVPKEKGTPVAKTLTTPAATRFKIPGSNGLDSGNVLSREGSSSNEDKIRKLRLKLLKKLKAKKHELASLERLAKTQQSGPFGVKANGVPQGGFNRKEHLRGFLQELQEQIDNVDNESVCTMSSSTSICSSPGDAEFFTELLSPSPVNQPSDSRYLEMLADGCGIAAAGQSHQVKDHQLSKERGVLQSTSGSNSCPTTSTLNHSNTDESLNLMSNSTLSILNEDNDYFHFDDYF